MPTKKRQVIVGKYGRPKKRKRLRIKIRFSRKFLYLIFLLVALGGIFYFLFVSGRLDIKNVNISGLRTISEEEVSVAANDVLGRKKFGILKERNYIVFSSKDMEASLSASFPKIANAKIQRTLEELNITLAERQTAGVWCLALRDLAKPDRIQDCFYFDKTGVIFEQAPRSFGSLIILVEDNRDIAANLGSVVLDPVQIDFFSEAHKLVSSNFLFSIREFSISADGAFEILTSENWRVLLDKNSGVEYQFSNLKYVLDEEIKTRHRELEYVDLRLGNRVYYKYRSDID